MKSHIEMIRVSYHYLGNVKTLGQTRPTTAGQCWCSTGTCHQKATVTAFPEQLLCPHCASGTTSGREENAGHISENCGRSRLHIPQKLLFRAPRQVLWSGSRLYCMEAGWEGCLTLWSPSLYAHVNTVVPLQEANCIWLRSHARIIESL